MSVTKDQAQMIANLAIACRPHRAATWDEAGVIANIAKVRERDLSLVVLAVIRAASDRDCVTPGVIPSNGSHWQEQLKAPKYEPEALSPEERCSVCAHPRHDAKCTRCAPIDDHTFASDFKTKRDGETVAQIVAAIKAEIQPTAPPPEPKRLDDLLPELRDAHVAELRDHITSHDVVEESA